jgi:hypothetical protein
MKRFVIALWILGAASDLAAVQPIVRLPQNGQRVVGGPDNDLCPSAEKPCREVYAEGSVPDDRIGIFAVEPLKGNGTIYIQPFTPDVFGGDVSQTVYLGRLDAGAREHFRIYLLGCSKGHRLRIGQETTLEKIGAVCTWSRPVTVYRVK